jgi:hypothetical protein
MDILLTFTGNRDPFNSEIVKGVFSDGPVLTLLAERSFTTLHIFTTPNTLPNAQRLQQEITARAENCRTRIHNLDIPVPSLRERREDIPLLVEYFLDRHNHRYHQKRQVSREVMRRILEYCWPGRRSVASKAAGRPRPVSSASNLTPSTSGPRKNSDCRSSGCKPPARVLSL